MIYGSHPSLGHSYSKNFNPVASHVINDLFWQKHEKIIVDYGEEQNFIFPMILK